MTATLHITDVITAIHGLVIPDLTICDLNDIPNEVDQRARYLIPSPVEPSPITDFTYERVSFGMDTALGDATYTLNYKLFYAPAGIERGLFDIYPGLLALAMDVVEKILQQSAINGAADWTPRLAEVGTYPDAVGKPWWGALIAVDVRDFAQ